MLRNVANTCKNEQKSQRAARLRDNKRRNRQRQKDYTSSLETQLRELQSRGVQATQEVQLSARKVVEENARLKALLRHVGVEDHMIETWKPDSTGQSPRVLSGCDKERAGTCVKKVSFLLDLSPILELITAKDGQHDVSPGGPSILHREPTELNAERKLPSEKGCQNKSSSQWVNKIADSEGTTKDKPITLTLAPCKVLTRLAEDPSVDVTQPIVSAENVDDHENGGVECSKAHTMLMQFATTEEKLDVISQALERGCVGKKGGGCKVRNEAIWQAIDDVT